MKNRRNGLLLGALALALLTGSVLAATGGLTVLLDGQRLPMRAIVRNGVVYLPAKELGAVLHFSVRVEGTRVSLRRANISDRAVMQERARGNEVVYVIPRRGFRYHRAGCRLLAGRGVPMLRKDALAKDYTPCTICKP